MLEIKGSRYQEKQAALGLLVWRDIRKHFYFYIALISVAATCMYIVSLVNDTRQNVKLKSKEYTKQEQLNNEFQQLFIEQQALSEISRISNIAKKSLNMHVPRIEEEQYIQISQEELEQQGLH